MRAADILKEHGFQFVGPGKHSISQALYLYVKDPGSGCRVELFTGGYLIFEPDWEPIRGHESERSFSNTYWGDSIEKKELVKTTIEAYAVTCGITFTFGGLKVNEQTEVQDRQYQTISGLYAAGEVIGGLFYSNYPGGAGLMAGTVFGKIAGEQAAGFVKNKTITI